MLCLYFLLDLVDVQVSDLCILSVENLGEFFKGWASGLDIEEVDECEFDEDPDPGDISKYALVRSGIQGLTV
jgi:hypothetical protein